MVHHLPPLELTGWLDWVGYRQLSLYAKEPSTAERGVKVTWALCGWLARVEGKADDNFEEDGMQIEPSHDGTQPNIHEQTFQSKKRAIILCIQQKLQGKFNLHPTV